VLIIGLYFVFQLIGYQHAVIDIEAHQNRSIDNLNQVVGEAQMALIDTNKEIQRATGLLAAGIEDETRQLASVDKRVTGYDQSLRGLRMRMRSLEAQSIHALALGMPPGTSPQAPALTTPVFGLHAPRLVKPGLGTKLVPNSALILHVHPINHVHQINLDIRPVQSIQIHVNAMGEKDYWLVPRSLPGGGQTIYRVQPYERTADGVKVHSIDDGQDYLLSQTGLWGNPR
jgi:hypothetical protein